MSDWSVELRRKKCRGPMFQHTEVHSAQGIPWKLGTSATHHLRSRCLHLLSQLECESRKKVGADYRNEIKSIGPPGQNSLCDGDVMILQLGIPEILRKTQILAHHVT